MKTITMMQFRRSPGEYAFRVRADGETFLVTYQGKPCFKMMPVSDVTVIQPDGTIKGPKPLTMGLDLGGEYARESSAQFSAASFREDVYILGTKWKLASIEP